MYIKTKLYVAQNIWQYEKDPKEITVRTSKVALKLGKPAYIGMWILELSKVLMNKFHYDYIKNKYENNSRPLFTNTDSYKYYVKII